MSTRIKAFKKNQFVRRESFQSLNDWIDEVKNNADPGAILVLVGNKVDLIET